MKYILFFLILIPAVKSSAQIDTGGKRATSIRNGIIYYKDNLPLFTIDSCIENLLIDITEADQGASYFEDQIGTRFYSLETQDHNKYLSLDIWPVRKVRSDFFDYYGAIEIQDAVFLLRGNYRSQSLFHPAIKDSLVIELQRPQQNKQMDAIDKKMYQLIHNIALYGTYVECTGFKIVPSIYIEGKLPGYKIGTKENSTSNRKKDFLSDEKYGKDDILTIYESAYQQLLKNIETNRSFKESIFITESAFFKNRLPVNDLDNLIIGLVDLCREWIAQNRLTDYRYKDSVDLITNLAIYKILKDTVHIDGGSKGSYYHPPFVYDFDDFFGREKWSNMFLSKLLISHRGNCHSLPYLYKILADELGATCWLALAPNHLYIKNRCKKIGWYNTELTSGEFPIDAWISTSGYIPIKAMQTGIYMDTLSNAQAVALCVLDLAKGYEAQTKSYYDGFIIKCCDFVLKHHLVNVQAMLFKAETLKRVYEKDKQPLVYDEMEKLYAGIYELGYREMPDKMYIQWLQSVTKQRDKYGNKQLKQMIKKKN